MHTHTHSKIYVDKLGKEPIDGKEGKKGSDKNNSPGKDKEPQGAGVGEESAVGDGEEGKVALSKKDKKNKDKQSKEAGTSAKTAVHVRAVLPPSLSLSHLCLSHLRSNHLRSNHLRSSRNRGRLVYWSWV